MYLWTDWRFRYQVVAVTMQFNPLERSELRFVFLLVGHLDESILNIPYGFQVQCMS